MNWAQLGAILAVRRRNRGAGVKEVVKRRHSPRNRAPADALGGPTMFSTVDCGLLASGSISPDLTLYTEVYASSKIHTLKPGRGRKGFG